MAKQKTSEKNVRVCNNGHTYYKSSDCPVCPICETEHKPTEGFLADISAPARRALTNAGVTTVSKLSKWKEADIVKLHGMGPATIPKLRAALKANGLSFA